MTYTYGNASHKHAVTATSNGWSFQYDANGNMVQRTIGGTVYNLTYDAENRLVSISGGATASFIYDGDGARVKGTVGGVTTTWNIAFVESQSGTALLQFRFIVNVWLCAAPAATVVGDGYQRQSAGRYFNTPAWAAERLSLSREHQ